MPACSSTGSIRVPIQLCNYVTALQKEVIITWKMETSGLC